MTMKMPNNLFFKLYANCIPVRGAAESLIMDLQRGEHFSIPNKLMDVLELVHENIPIKEVKKHFNGDYNKGIDAFFGMLEVNEYGFFSNEPESFPNISTQFEFPSKIVSSIISLNENTKFNLSSLLIKLDDLGCQIIQIRILDSYPIEFIKEALINVSESDIKNLELFVPDKFSTDEKLIELMHTSLRVSMVVYDSSKERKLKILRHRNRYVYFIEDTLSKESKELYGKHLMKCNMNFYCEAKNFNVGLNKKITIDESGEISNYFSHKESFGNIESIEIEKLLQDEEFRYKWLINNDKIEKCKDCQYRYMCLSNSDIVKNNDKFFKVDNCGFNPLKNTWD